MRETYRKLGVGVKVILICVMLSVPFAALATGTTVTRAVGPTILVSPTSGPRGETVSVTGSNFDANETGITVTWDGTTNVIEGITADGAGSWGPETFDVPVDAPADDHIVDAYGDTTPYTEVADVAFTVIPTVEIESATLAVSASSSVDIWVRNYPAAPQVVDYGLGCYDIEVHFDPLAVQIDSVSDGDSPFDAPIPNIYADYVHITQFQVTSITDPDGDIRICDLEFTCLAEGETTLALTVNTLADIDANPIAHSTVDGTITQVVPSIDVVPTAGPRGTSVDVSGTDFTANETGIKVTWDSGNITAGVTADGTGAWSDSFNVPLTATLGANTVDAYGDVTAATQVDDVTFTVSTPAIAINPTSGPAGTTVEVTGTDFAVSETGIAVTWDGGATTITGVTADGTGAWGPETFDVPIDAPAGDYAVDASGLYTGAGEVADETFTVIPTVEVEGTTVTVNSSSSVDIWVRNYPAVPGVTPYGLGAYAIRIDFDPLAIDVTGVSNGDSPFDAPNSDIYADYVEIDQTSGQAPGPSGDIRICDLEFDCLADGETTLYLTVTTLDNTNGDPVDHTAVDGTITQISYAAEVAIGEEQDVDNVVVIPVTIVRVKDPVTGVTIPGIETADYAASMLFDPAFMEILEIRGGDPPFDSIPPENIDINNVAGTASVSDDVPSGTLPDIIAFRIVARLTGSAEVSNSLSVDVAEVGTTGGATMLVPDQPMTLSFLRGDIKKTDPGTVNITDAMFGAQWCVGLRGVEDINQLNMASVKHDGTDGDIKNITDCMFIAQKAVGLRDEYFELSTP